MNSFEVLGLSFHWYGLIIGFALVVTIWLFEKQFAKAKLPEKCLSILIPSTLIGALLGARIWHVITDWQLYINDPIASFYLWRGGLSIIGAIFGIGGAIYLVKKYQVRCKAVTFLAVTDALAFAIPVGQAIGRLGNWINQELYGLPTDLPWKIYINPERRLVGYETIEYYHPLFLYESMLLLIFAATLWLLQNKSANLKIGAGMATWLYLFWYGLVRFLLEFLRLEKPGLFFWGLSINQLVAVVMCLVAIAFLFKMINKTTLSKLS